MGLRPVIFLFVSLLFSTVQILFQPHSSEIMRFIPFAVAAGAGFIARRDERCVPALLGLSLPVMPFFRSGALDLVFGAILLARWRCQRAIHTPLLAIGGVMMLGAISTAVQGIDLALLRANWVEGGAVGELRYLVVNNPRWFVALDTLLGFVLSVLLFCRGVSTEVEWRILLRALGAGVVVSSSVAVVQWIAPQSPASWNMSAFWTMLGRSAGTSTDPNALGVLAALLVPVLFPLRWAFVFLVVGGLVSGSRTFLLGLCAVVSVAGVRKPLILAGGLAGVAVAMLPPVNEFLQSVLPFPAVVRLLLTVHLDHFQEMVASRTLFASLALQVWGHYPWVGVGLDRFYEMQTNPSFGAALAGWQDNANNYYLHILVEHGLLGAGIILLAFFAISRSQKGEENSGKTHFALALLTFLLLTGPHLIFDEVRHLVALFLSFALPIGVGGRARSSLLKVLLLVYSGCLLVTLERPGEKGLYPVEFHDGRAVRWSVDQGQLKLCGDSPVRFRSLEPNVAELRVEVEIGGKTHAVAVDDNEWQTVELAGMQQLPALASFSVSHLWNPERAGVGLDPRWLGVLFEWRGCP